MNDRLDNSLLKVDSAVQQFGGLVAVNDVTLTIRKGEVKGLIGPNGAGKSTMFDIITGVRRPTSGEVWFKGQRLTREPAHTRSPMGMSRTFQIVRLFRGISVLENVMLGLHPKFPDGLLASLMAFGGLGAQEKSARARGMELLEFVGLADRAGSKIEQLTLGQLRLVDIGRALAADPDLLMLDEPAAGLNDAETDNLAQMLARLKGDGMSMLVVEHDVDFIMNACDTIAVMDHGSKIADGTPDEVRTNHDVIAAYIGKRAADAAS